MLRSSPWLTMTQSLSRPASSTADLAPKARATAWSDDGLLEGFELDDGWVVAVQWHPEVTAADDPVQQRLFDAFVAECAT